MRPNKIEAKKDDREKEAEWFKSTQNSKDDLTDLARKQIIYMYGM